MKNKNLFILAAVGVVLWILQKKRVFDSLDLRPGFPRDLQLNNVTNLSFILPFTAFNGSDGRLNIGGVDLRVFAEGRYVGRALATGNQVVMPYGQTILTTQVFMNLIDLAAVVTGFANGSHDQVVDFVFKGTLNVEGIYVPVTIPVSINLPQFN